MDQLVAQLGVLMGLVLLLAFLFRKLRLSLILSYIAAGVLAHLVFARAGAKLDHALEHTLPELGIMLLLFCAGMEIEFAHVRKRLGSILVIAGSQMAGTLLLGFGIACLVLDVGSVATAVYVGLCLTFSSTVIVVQWLNERRQLDSLHGMILLGLLVLQDIAAVLSLAVLESLVGGSLGAGLFAVLVKLVVIATVLFLIGRYVLTWLFDRCAASAELFFVATFAWCFGVAGLCHLIHFSAELAAFLAGVALANLRHYKLEISDKVEPLRDLGLILFFTSLGMGLKFSNQILEYSVGIGLMLLVVWFGTMLLMGFAARSRGLRKRTVFMVALLPTQISEFSLVLATLCLKAGVFDAAVFGVVTWAAIFSIFAFSLGSSHLERLYERFGVFMNWLERGAKDRVEGLDEQALADHTIVMGFNPIGRAVVNALLARGEKVVLVDLDPDVHAEAQGLMAEHKERLGFIFGDMGDPDVWVEAGMRKARLIVSCLQGGQTDELGILEWKRKHNAGARSVVVAETPEHAAALREGGADYVLVPEHLAAAEIETLFSASDFPENLIAQTE